MITQQTIIDVLANHYAIKKQRCTEDVIIKSIELNQRIDRLIQDKTDEEKREAERQLWWQKMRDFEVQDGDRVILDDWMNPQNSLWNYAGAIVHRKTDDTLWVTRGGFRSGWAGGSYFLAIRTEEGARFKLPEQDLRCEMDWGAAVEWRCSEPIVFDYDGRIHDWFRYDGGYADVRPKNWSKPPLAKISGHGGERWAHWERMNNRWYAIEQPASAEHLNLFNALWGQSFDFWYSTERGPCTRYGRTTREPVWVIEERERKQREWEEKKREERMRRSEEQKLADAEKLRLRKRRSLERRRERLIMSSETQRVFNAMGAITTIAQIAKQDHENNNNA